MGEWVEASNLSRARSDQKTTALAAGIFRSPVAQRREQHPKMEICVENPVRAGLVQQADDWSYQGEFVVIDRA